MLIWINVMTHKCFEMRFSCCLFASTLVLFWCQQILYKYTYGWRGLLDQKGTRRHDQGKYWHRSNMKFKSIHQMFVSSPGRLMLSPQLFLRRFDCSYLPSPPSHAHSILRSWIKPITGRINPFDTLLSPQVRNLTADGCKKSTRASSCEWLRQTLAGSCKEIPKTFFFSSLPQI